MIIQVIGLGVVGKAQAFLLSSLGHKVYGYDIAKVKAERYFDVVQSPVKDVDVTFICVPEKVAEETVAGLVDAGVGGLIVIKSTVPPGTTVSLMSKFGVHLCHNPEFLREKVAFDDVLKPSRVVIGQCCARHGSVLLEIYRSLQAPIYVTDPTTSEMVKLASNTLRAVNITFWNIIHGLATELLVDTRDVADMADPVKVLGEWEGGGWGVKMFGRPYDGKCLPKDMNMLAETLRSNGLDSSVIDSMQKFNEALKLNNGKASP
ncbi:MAG: NAD(P)-binding domain-containing protein [Candidatus Bathyarchaeota archaeon]|nr:NAD(P)-binding domain-containing protein [Candidatus Bathyarchaeota archaeon]